jgi:hypothetical protein
MDNQAFAEMIETIKKKKKKKVAATSVAAYKETEGARVSEKKRITAFIEKHPGCSRDDIVEGTKIKLQSVTGNVTSLVKNGHIEEQGVKLNTAGNKVGRLWPPCVSSKECPPNESGAHSKVVEIGASK